MMHPATHRYSTNSTNKLQVCGIHLHWSIRGVLPAACQLVGEALNPEKLSLPDASRSAVHACGRLIR